ncbi:hypothetical protein SDC9_103453 [bioreactor metagenome]|uniref:Uncharacterized protein n=1 Tax=bioreactor metagenome TaxID=1076179 RepID=A0A645B4J2_9ZZZZ
MKHILFVLFILMVLTSNAQTDSIIVLKERLKSSGLNLNTYKQKESTRWLILSDYQDAVFPSEILLEFPNLETVSFYKPYFIPDSSQMPRILIDTIGVNHFQKLKNLYFSSCVPENLPNTGILADSLIYLGLVQARLDSVPEAVYHYKNLQNLSLASNNLSTISDEISSLSNLTSLDISDNAFEQFPRSIGSLTKLKYLFLGRIAPAEEFGSAKYLEEIDFVKRLAAGDSLTRLQLWVGSSAEKRFLKKQIHNDTNHRKIYIYNLHPWWFFDSDTTFYHINYAHNLCTFFDDEGTQQLFENRGWPTIKPGLYYFSFGADVSYKWMSAGCDLGRTFNRQSSKGDSMVISSMDNFGFWVGARLFSIKKVSFDVQLGTMMCSSNLNFSYVDSTMTFSDYLDNTSNNFHLKYIRDYYRLAAGLKYNAGKFDFGIRQSFLIPVEYGTWRLDQQELINNTGAHIRYYGYTTVYVSFRIPQPQ